MKYNIKNYIKMWNILLIWPSWAWKTTVSKKIIDNYWNFSNFIADTSREIRNWEVNWLDYNFVTSEFIISNYKNKDKYLMEEYFLNYYWYNLENFNINTNFILSPWINVADTILKEMEKFWFVVSILLNIDRKTFIERLKFRWESESEILKREKSLELLDFSNKVDFILNWNSNLDYLVKDIYNILFNKNF